MCAQKKLELTGQHLGIQYQMILKDKRALVYQKIHDFLHNLFESIKSSLSYKSKWFHGLARLLVASFSWFFLFSFPSSVFSSHILSFFAFASVVSWREGSAPLLKFMRDFGGMSTLSLNIF